MNAPGRTVSLSPNVSMILFALGVDGVIGRTQFCQSSICHYLDVWGIAESDAAPRLRHWEALPVVGAWPQADCERVAVLQPDLILTSGTGALDAYDASSFQVAPDRLINFDTRTLAELDRQITAIGEITGKADAAKDLIAQLAARRQAIAARRAPLTRRPSVLFEYCVCIKYDPDPARRFANPGRFVMVGGHLAPDLIRLSGGEPLFTQPGDAVAWTAFEAIREAQPDLVLVYDCNGCPNAKRHPIESRPGWAELAAVSDGAVYTLGKNISNPNLCYPEALDELAEVVAAWGRARQS